MACVYAPQEAKSQQLYAEIKEMAKAVAKQDEELLIMGDFNCKIGKIIKNNVDKVTTGGKKLLKLVSDQKLFIVNT